MKVRVCTSSGKTCVGEFPEECLGKEERGAMTRATGCGSLSRPRRCEQATEMPARCLGLRRPRRGVRKSWRRKQAAGASRGRKTKRHSRFSVWGTGCVSTERPQECRQPRGRRPGAETAETAGANETVGTPGTAGSVEAARDPETVWVNGAVGRPEVMGPTGSVWVTGTGDEETDCRSPLACERKGRPGSLGHGSILALWLKVQAMRAASGCEEERVELYPVPAGEGPVERGVPGQASWLETSRGGLTGPWVKGHVRAVSRATGVPTAQGLAAVYEKALRFCGQGQAVRMLGTRDSSSGIAPCLWGRRHTVGMPEAMKEIGCGVVPGLWGKGQLPGAMGWPEAAGLPRALKGKIGCEGAPGLWERRQPQQVSGTQGEETVCCINTPSLWGRGQTAVVEETRSMGVPGMWQKRQAVEAISSDDIRGLWGTGQPVVVPYATEEETRYGGDPGCQERGQALWIEPNSVGDPGSWRAIQNVGASGTDEEAGSRGAPGLWGMEQAVGVPKTLGEKTGYRRVPHQWGEEPVGVAQALVVPRAVGEETGYGGIPGMWYRQQALGAPPAGMGVVGEETRCGCVLSQWERRQVVGQQETRVPTASGIYGPADQETGSGAVSCLCGRRQAVGSSSTVGFPEAASVPKHKCTPVGLTMAVDFPRSERVPAAVWVSGPMGQEASPKDVLNLWEKVRVPQMPMASGLCMPPEELWFVGEDTDSGAFPGSWGRREAVGVPMTTRVSVDPEVPGPVGKEPSSSGVPRLWRRRQAARVPMAAEVPTSSRVPDPAGMEPGFEGFSGLLGRKQIVQVPVTVEVSTAGRMPMSPRWPRLVREETVSGGDTSLWGGKGTVGVPADTRGPTMPMSVRMAGPMEEKTVSGEVSGLSGGRPTAGLPVALGLHTATGLEGEEIQPRGLLYVSGKRQTAEMPVAARISTAVGVPTATGAPGPLVGNTSSKDISDIGGRKQASEIPIAARVSGPVKGETGSDGVSSLWKRQTRVVPGAVRESQSVGMPAAVGEPMPGQVPAAVWVTGSTREEMNRGVSGLTAVRRESTEGPGASEEETGGRSILEKAGRRQARGVLHMCGGRARLWGCPRFVGEETDYGDIPGVSEVRTSRGVREAVGAPEALGSPPVSREETGFGHFAGHPQQRGKRQTGAVSGIRVREDNLGENYVEEDRLRGASQ